MKNLVVVAPYQRGGQIDIVFQRQREAKRVRWLQAAAEHVLRVHRSSSGDLAIGHGVTNRYCTVMAAQALIAGVAERGLSADVRFSRAVVHRVDLSG